MGNFEQKMRQLAEELLRLAESCKEIERLSKDLAGDQKSLDKLKCCTNCLHSTVCAVVAERRRKYANNYTPCEHWKLTDGENG